MLAHRRDHCCMDDGFGIALANEKEIPQSYKLQTRMDIYLNQGWVKFIPCGPQINDTCLQRNCYTEMVIL